MCSEPSFAISVIADGTNFPAYGVAGRWTCLWWGGLGLAAGGAALRSLCTILNPGVLRAGECRYLSNHDHGRGNGPGRLGFILWNHIKLPFGGWQADKIQRNVEATLWTAQFVHPVHDCCSDKIGRRAWGYKPTKAFKRQTAIVKVSVETIWVDGTLVSIGRVWELFNLLRFAIKAEEVERGDLGCDRIPEKRTFEFSEGVSVIINLYIWRSTTRCLYICSFFRCPRSPLECFLSYNIEAQIPVILIAPESIIFP